MQKNPQENYLKKNELIMGGWYVCYARNFEYGQWNGKTFDYLRYKFGQKFLDTELHWDDDPHHGTVKPIRAVNPADVPLDAVLPRVTHEPRA